MPNIVSMIASTLGEAFGLVDDLHTSDQEKAEAKAKLAKIYNEKFTTALEFQQEIVEQQGKIIQAEAKSEHLLTSIWRPITMLSFVAIVVSHAFGIATVPEAFAQEVFGLIKLGLGGYIIGRSGEKMTEQAKGVARAYAEGKNGRE